MEKLSIYTLYQNPSDFPGKFVVRRFENDQPTKDIWIGDSVDEVQQHIPPGLIWIDRNPNDDPVIVGTWL